MCNSPEAITRIKRELEVDQWNVLVVDVSPDRVDWVSWVEERMAAKTVLFVNLIPVGQFAPEEKLRIWASLVLQRERLIRLGVPIVFWMSYEDFGEIVQHIGDIFVNQLGLFRL